MFKNYVTMWRYFYDFKTTENRRTFWNAMLINFLVSLCLTFLGALIPSVMLIVALIYSVLSLVPVISITVRRLHDTDITGLYLFVSFIPIAGLVLLIVQLCKPSTYNPETKRVEETVIQEDEKADVKQAEIADTIDK